MNGSKTDRQRRQALKKILAGSSVLGASAVVPDKWVKPVVDAVVLPAHAQASPVATPTPTPPPVVPPLNATWAGGSGGPGPIGGVEPKSNEGLAQRLLGQIVPEARAGDDGNGICPTGVIVCLDTISVDEGQVHVFLQVFGAVFADATATVVDREIKQPFLIEGYTVTGTLSGDDQTWDGRVMGSCPAVNGKINVERNGVFTGERIDVAALELAGGLMNGYLDLDVAYTAVRDAPCPNDD